jgi:hypothetical protein
MQRRNAREKAREGAVAVLAVVALDLFGEGRGARLGVRVAGVDRRAAFVFFFEFGRGTLGSLVS